MRLVAVVLVVLSTGCSGLKTYPADAGGNLAVRAQLDGAVRATLHVHRVDAQCRTEYRGSVRLDRPVALLNVPAGETSYLVATFDTSSFLSGSRSTNAGALLRPVAGRSYELALRYRDDIYDVSLREVDERGAGREIPRRDLGACRGS